MVTDLYQLTMVSSYLRRDMTAPATFSLFERDLPPTRGFLGAAGLEDSLQFLQDFRFDDEDPDYLATIGHSTEVLRRLSSRRFTGDRRPCSSRLPNVTGYGEGKDHSEADRKEKTCAPSLER